MRFAKILFAATAALSTAALQSETLTDLLTQEEFAAAGLDKLTPEELAQLDQLWTRHASETPVPPITPEKPSPAPIVATVVASASPDDLLGKEQIAIDVKKAPKKIESRLVGKFEGWHGNTLFTLENGQVWQQRIDEKQKYDPAENPAVTIQKGLGGYRIHFEGYKQTCPVKRIK